MTARQSFAPYFSVNPANAAGDDHKAALLLHTLPAADRAWLLERLPSDEREPLQILLAELAQLGIPADRPLLHEVIGDAADAGMARGGAPAGSHESSIQALSAIDAAVMGQMLRDEPAVLIAHLLIIHSWPWRAAVLEQIDVFKRRQVENNVVLLRRKIACAAAPDENTPFVKLHRQLLATLQARLELRHPDWRVGVNQGSGPAIARSANVLIKEWLRRLESGLAGIRRGGRS